MLFGVGAPECVETGCCGPVEIGAARFGRKRAGRFPVPPPEIGTDRDKQQDGIRPACGQGVCSGCDGSPFGQQPGADFETDSAAPFRIGLGDFVPAGVNRADAVQEEVARFDADSVPQRRIERQREAGRSGGGRGTAHDEHLMRGGDEPFAEESAGPGRGDGLRQLQLPAVFSGRKRTGKAEFQPPGRKIPFAVVMQHMRGDEFVRFGKPPLPQEPAGFAELLEVAAFVEAARPSAPQGIFVEFDELLVGTAVDHGADAAVSERKRFLPAACRVPVKEKMLSVRHESLPKCFQQRTPRSSGRQPRRRNNREKDGAAIDNSGLFWYNYRMKQHVVCCLGGNECRRT